MDKRFKVGDAVRVWRLGDSVDGIVTGHFDFPVTSGYLGGRTEYRVSTKEYGLVWVVEGRIMRAE